MSKLFGKRHGSGLRSLAAGIVFSIAVGAAVGSAAALAPSAQAQNFGQRTIIGKVVDDTETPVSGATVFLKNVKTKNVKSFTSQATGDYRFAQVGMTDDYEVWAEHGKTKSPVKTISSFDSRKELNIQLKLK